MKARKTFLFLTLILILVSFSLAQKDPKILKFPDMEFKPLKPGFMHIKKGVDFYFKEDHEVPVINVYIILKSGRLHDPKGKDGLASLTMRLMKSGGTKNLTPEKLEERLDFLGSSISVFAGAEYSWVTLWTLKKNFDESWKILTDILFNPLFDKERLDVEKKKELEDIRRRWDRPMSVGFLLFQDLIYGRDFPDVRRTTTQSIESISSDDVKAFYNENIKDKEIIVAFAGDFDAKRISFLIKKDFKDWKGVSPSKLDLPKAKLAAKPGLYLINKEDMTQGVICMGHLGINRLDSDNVEINVLNFILGTGAFSSRLMREVRSNRGLAYATYGYVGSGRDLGPFFNFCQTKNQSVGEAISLMREIMEDMTKNPVTSEEIETAKKSEQNSFVHRFDSASAILLESVLLKSQGYPENYLETYIPRIRKVNDRKVLEMAKRTIHPDNLVILVVGKKNEIIDQLKLLNLGEIKELPLPKE
ncbi:MAG: pitrilysin family protein [Acidobacteriota bacterium]